MIYLFWLLLFYDRRYVTCINEHRAYSYRGKWAEDERIIMNGMIAQLAGDVIKEQNSRDFMLYNIRHDNIVSAAYEIGYMTQVIQEHYRRMLDKWYSARKDIRAFYNTEIALYLEEIEHLYWSIKHEVYMMHEIERKYKITEGALNETYVDAALGVTPVLPTPPAINQISEKPPQVKPNKMVENFFAKFSGNDDVKDGGGQSGGGKDGGGKHGGKGGKGGKGGSRFDHPAWQPQASPKFTTKKPDKTRWPRQYGWDIWEWYS